MIVGKFVIEGDGYIGTAPAFASNNSVWILPSRQKGVDYDVTLADSGIEIGVAWKKISSKGNAYLSVKLDTPTLAAPVNCALLKQDDGSHALVWKRNATSDTKVDEPSEAAAA